jgi:hypothetical protein
MGGLVQDLRYALRQLRKSPGFTFTSILTLGLGIGATMAVFSVTNAVLLNPSGIPHPKDVVALRAKYTFGDLANINISSTDFGDAVSAKKIFTSAAVLMGEDFNYTSGDAIPQRLSGALVSWQWFDVFWAHPYLGRVFHPEEDQPKANHEVVLSYRAWRERFGGDPSIIGRKLLLDQESYEVVGVMGPDFAWPNQAELWIPIGLPPGSYFDPQLRHNEYLFGAARLAPGVTLAQANTYLAARSAQVAASEHLPINVGWGIFCMPLVEYVTGDLREPLRQYCWTSTRPSVGTTARILDPNRSGCGQLSSSTTGAHRRALSGTRRRSSWLAVSQGGHSTSFAACACRTNAEHFRPDGRDCDAVLDRSYKFVRCALRRSSSLAIDSRKLVSGVAGRRPVRGSKSRPSALSLGVGDHGDRHGYGSAAGVRTFGSQP